MALPVEALAQVRENIKVAEAQLKELDSLIRDARVAGIDVTDKTKEAEELKKQIRQLKAVYGR